MTPEQRKWFFSWLADSGRYIIDFESWFDEQIALAKNPSIDTNLEADLERSDENLSE